MEVPDGLEKKIYTTLIKLYADQMGVTIKGEIEIGGEKIGIDTSKLLLREM